MKTRKLFAILLAALMIMAILPMSALAAGVSQAATYRKMWRDTDAIWARIDAAVAELDAAGAGQSDIIKAVYDIASNGEGIVSCVVENGETVNFVHESGMENIYSWRVNHSATAIPHDKSQDFVETTLRELETATDLDVLLLGPYYGQDSSFTNQYRNEAQSIANYTQGNYTLYSGTNVDANACRAAEDYGIIIFDSHGICSGGRSYLCLTTNAGFTSEDYAQHRAARSGSEAWVTGAFWEYYCPDMKAACVWMAICEGMMTNTLGGPLLNAGCAVVYGYSQSVTFAGDYLMEATFWNHMKQGETFVESYDAMITAHGNDDPYGNAYPVVMSEVDDYPANPDSHQTVYCQWHLPTPSDLVVTDVVGVSFAESTIGIAPTFTERLIPIVNPEDANNYNSSWTSSNESVATVDRKGNVTGLSEGTTTVTYTVTSKPTSNTNYTYSASVVVNVSNQYLPMEVMYVPVSELVPGETYLIGYTQGTRNVIMGNEYYDTNNNRSLKPVTITLGDYNGKTYVTSAVAAGQEWIWGADGSIKNAGNNLYLNLTGNYLTMGANTAQWSFAPTDNATTGVITNNANATFKYLGVSNSVTYFGVFFSGYQMQLYRKLVRAASGLMGDANGDGIVDSSDALLIVRYSSDPSAIPAGNVANCDVNGDGSIDSADALIILRQSMGL
jgi:hypothetical protein